MPLIALVDSLGQVLPCQEVEGLGPGLKFESKIWGNITKSEESLGRSGITRGKKWDIIQG